VTRRSEGWRVAWQRGLNYTWRDAFSSSVSDVDDAAMMVLMMFRNTGEPISYLKKIY
jgi:hypothetical protein